MGSEMCIRDRFRLVPATERLSLLLLPDGDLVVGRRSLAPVWSGEPTEHPAFSATAPWNRSSQRPVVAAHTGRSSPSPYTVYQTWCYITQHPLSSLYSAQTALPLDCSLRCHSLPNTRAFTSTVYSLLISLAKFLRQLLKHVRFTCTKSPDRHTVDPTANHVPMHSCPHVASENNNEADRLT